MGVILMLMTIVGLFTAVILLVAAFLTRTTRLAKFTFAAIAIWLGFYVVLLLGFSLASKPHALGVGEAKEFCGFYIDCHIHVQLTSVRTTGEIGDRKANGTFYIVGLRVLSDAKNPNLPFRLIEPRALIEVNDHTVIERDRAAEAWLPTASVDLGGEIKGSQTIDKEIVFDIPKDLPDPELHMAEGYGIDYAIEAFLIDDQDSIWHQHTYFALGSPVASR